MTAAISVSGMAKRTVRARASTSAVVRDTRSPVPARSTVESGSASTRCMKSSRSSANIFSERTNDARRAKNVSDRLGDQRDREQQEHEHVDVPARGAVLNRLDDHPEQRWAGQPCSSGCRMEADRARERASVTTPEAARLNAKIGTVGDRKEIAHRSSPRVTVQL